MTIINRAWRAALSIGANLAKWNEAAETLTIRALQSMTSRAIRAWRDALKIGGIADLARLMSDRRSEKSSEALGAASSLPLNNWNSKGNGYVLVRRSETLGAEAAAAYPYPAGVGGRSQTSFSSGMNLCPSRNYFSGMNNCKESWEYQDDVQGNEKFVLRLVVDQDQGPRAALDFVGGLSDRGHRVTPEMIITILVSLRDKGTDVDLHLCRLTIHYSEKNFGVVPTVDMFNLVAEGFFDRDDYVGGKKLISDMTQVYGIKGNLKTEEIVARAEEEKVKGEEDGGRGRQRQRLMKEVLKDAGEYW